MFKRIAVALALALVFVAVLAAVGNASPLARECGVTMPCYGAEAATARGSRAARPGRGVVHGGRPEACRVSIKGRLIPWCGCWLALRKGMRDRALWLARNWARVGKGLAGPRVGAVVVWRHHVGIVTAVDGKRIRVLSGNDGNAVRERWRSMAGVIAWRMI